VQHERAGLEVRGVGRGHRVRHIVLADEVAEERQAHRRGVGFADDDHSDPVVEAIEELRLPARHDDRGVAERAGGRAALAEDAMGPRLVQLVRALEGEDRRRHRRGVEADSVVAEADRRPRARIVGVEHHHLGLGCKLGALIRSDAGHALGDGEELPRGFDGRVEGEALLTLGLQLDDGVPHVRDALVDHAGWVGAARDCAPVGLAVAEVADLVADRPLDQILELVNVSNGAGLDGGLDDRIHGQPPPAAARPSSVRR